MSLRASDIAPSETSRLFLYREDEGERKFLLLRKSYGDRLYETPGGSIEAGESPDQCLEREALEELGIEVDPEDTEKVLDGRIQATPRGNYRIFGYTADLEKIEDLKLSGEHSSYVWASEARIQELNSRGKIIEGLEPLIHSISDTD